MSMQLSNKPFYVMERQKFVNLRNQAPFVNLRNIYPSRGVVGFLGFRQRILQGDYKFRGGGGCVKTPAGAMSTYSLLIIALYLAAKFINFPGKI